MSQAAQCRAAVDCAVGGVQVYRVEEPTLPTARSGLVEHDHEARRGRISEREGVGPRSPLGEGLPGCIRRRGLDEQVVEDIEPERARSSLGADMPVPGAVERLGGQDLDRPGVEVGRPQMDGGRESSPEDISAATLSGTDIT